ncbi:MAG: hypothetical protein FWE84_01745 [Firmicutes bacterium]|nr:hypothetical protein [Bacillota bacterium]
MSLNASKFNRGDIVQSKAGHDTDRVYVVADAGEEFSLAVDGEYRTLKTPKKKRNKHLRFLSAGELPEKVTDIKIKKIIKDWKAKCPGKTI